MLYIGIDVAKRSHVAAAMGDGEEVVVEPFEFANTQRGFERLLRRLAKRGVGPGGAKVGMEATGHYWVALFDFLKMPLGEGALYFGMVYNFLPFMIYPIYNSLEKLDNSYVEAAQDLGATPWKVFWKVTVPLSLPGVWSGVLMVFMPTISTFAIAELLTLNKVKLFGTTIQENINNGFWNYGSALALIMLLIIGLTTLISDEDSARDSEKGGLI